MVRITVISLNEEKDKKAFVMFITRFLSNQKGKTRLLSARSMSRKINFSQRGEKNDKELNTKGENVLKIDSLSGKKD